jgi:hypothetical protein
MPRQGPYIESFVNLGRAVNVASIALTLGVPDDDAYRQIFPDPGFVKVYLPFLKEHGLSLFSDPTFEMQGHTIAERPGQATGNQCLGAFDSATSITNSKGRFFKVAGWAWQKQPRRNVEKVLLVDDNGGSRSDVAKFFCAHRMAETGWNGYVNLPRASRALTAYGLLDSDPNRCRIGRIELDSR